VRGVGNEVVFGGEEGGKGGRYEVEGVTEEFGFFMAVLARSVWPCFVSRLFSCLA